MNHIFENEAVQHENRLAPRSWYIPYDTKEKALAGKPKDSAYYQTLNGTWQFRYYQSYASETGTPWADMPVPSCWQMHGYGRAEYSNIKYVIPFDPPYVPTENPMGVYRRSFTISEKWMKRETDIVFEGVVSCFFLYINDTYVGYSQGSHMQAEFNLKPYLKKGENTIVVKVLQWCDGTYLEDQDMLRLSGIFRDVYLLSRGETVQRDFLVKADSKHIEVNAEKYDIYFEGEKTDCPDKLWTAETPNVYTLVVENGDEYIPFTVGMRDIAVSDKGELLINSCPVKLRGVNYHETNPYTGYFVENFERDILLMKELNINCIRFSHYPSHPHMLELCDRYGIYVVDEADIEAHGQASIHWDKNLNYTGWNTDIHDEAWFCCDPKWENAYMDRAVRMYERDKNHVSVIMWSLGNEGGFGANHITMSNYFHKVDPVRLVHYENAKPFGDPKEVVDVVSRMYASIQEMTEEHKGNRPFFLCEYSHAAGNGPGDVGDYWKEIYRTNNFIGGCIWEWCDHAVWKDGAMRYGGDFGEKIHSGHACCDGIVSANREFRASSLAVKEVYAGFDSEYQNGKLSITNRYDFLNLNEFDICIRVVCDGEETTRSLLKLNLEPHKTVELDCNISVPERCEYGTYLFVSLLKGEKKLAERQHRLPSSVRPLVAEAAEIIIKKQSDTVVEICEGSNVYLFDTLRGCFTQMNGLLKAPVVLDTWRAPIDNERGINPTPGITEAIPRYVSFNSNCMTTKVYHCEICNNTIVVEGGLVPIAMSCLFRFTCKYTFVKGGVCVELSGQFRKDIDFVQRLGFTFALSSENTAFSYYGGGPSECYADLYQHAPVGLYHSTAEAEYVPYIMPQEHGNHNRTTELWLPGICFESDKAFEFNVSRYSTEMLTQAKHTDELKQSENMLVRVDYQCSGVGSGTCGAKNEKYSFKGGEIHFSFVIRMEETPPEIPKREKNSCKNIVIKNIAKGSLL